MSWSSRKKKGHFLYRLFCPKEIFNICVLIDIRTFAIFWCWNELTANYELIFWTSPDILIWSRIFESLAV